MVAMVYHSFGKCCILHLNIMVRVTLSFSQHPFVTRSIVILNA